MHKLYAIILSSHNPKERCSKACDATTSCIRRRTGFTEIGAALCGPRPAGSLVFIEPISSQKMQSIEGPQLVHRKCSPDILIPNPASDHLLGGHLLTFVLACVGMCSAHFLHVFVCPCVRLVCFCICLQCYGHVFGVRWRFLLLPSLVWVACFGNAWHAFCMLLVFVCIIKYLSLT